MAGRRIPPHDRATQKDRILEWLETVPALIRGATEEPVCVGLKLFNAMFEDDFQVEMLGRVMGSRLDHRPDFVTFANRLFDPDREFEGKVGVAYGGPDLSDRNLAVLDAHRTAAEAGQWAPLTIPISATGDICTGRIAMEYAIRGCSSFQLHTFFQLPAEAYALRVGTKVSKALHLLYFHPQDGLIAWLRHLAEQTGRIDADGTIRFRDVVGCVTSFE